MLYRPVDNEFLDACKPDAFWETKEGLKADFPSTKKIRAYNADAIAAYCKTRDLDKDKLEVCR